MIQTLSFASTATPIVAPITQWFGSGFGHIGSTSNRGACAAAASTTVFLSSTEAPTASATRTATKIAPRQYVRFILPPSRLAYAMIHDSEDYGCSAPFSGRD